MLIDSHVHIFSPSVKNNKNSYASDENFRLLHQSSTARIATGDDLIGYMDRNSIDRTVAMSFAWMNEGFSHEQNLYLQEAMKSSNGRILAFGSVPRVATKDVYSQVLNIKELGFYGVGEIAFYAEGFSSGSAEFLREVLASANKLSLPVCLHVNEPVGHVYSGKYEPNFAMLYRILSDFQNVRIILSHWGGGIFLYELMPETARIFKNVKYDTAATPFLYNEKIYPTACAALGPEKIIFGSDYPLLGIKRYLNPLRNAVADPGAIERILYKNIEELLAL